MFSSSIVNTAIGLVLLFAVTATLCSGLTETVSNLMQLRARYLLTALRAMLDRPEGASTAGLANDKSVKSDLNNNTKNSAATKTALDTLVETVRAAAATAAQAAQAAPTVRVDRSQLGGDPNSGPARTAPEPNVTLALFDHPAIKALQTRRVGAFKVAGTLRNPQYISARTFSRALIDTLFPDAVARGPLGQGSLLVAVQDGVRLLPDQLPVKKQLTSLANRAEGSLEAFETSLEKWYDDEMATIAGWYKRWARVVLGCFGFAIAIAINFDTLQVAHSLYVDAPVQQAVVAEASAGSLCQSTPPGKAQQKCVTSELESLHSEGIPFGYPSTCQPLKGEFADCWSWAPKDPRHWYDPFLKLIGWLTTAFAISFGGPFWFDALSKLGNLRSTGNKPASTA